MQNLVRDLLAPYTTPKPPVSLFPLSHSETMHHNCGVCAHIVHSAVRALECHVCARRAHTLVAAEHSTTAKWLTDLSQFINSTHTHRCTQHHAYAPAHSLAAGAFKCAPRTIDLLPFVRVTCSRARVLFVRESRAAWLYHLGVKLLMYHTAGEVSAFRRCLLSYTNHTLPRRCRLYLNDDPMPFHRMACCRSISHARNPRRLLNVIGGGERVREKTLYPQQTPLQIIAHVFSSRQMCFTCGHRIASIGLMMHAH